MRLLRYPRTKAIDADGKLIKDYDYELELADPRPHVRLSRLVRAITGCTAHRDVRPDATELADQGRQETLPRAATTASCWFGLALLGQLIRLEQFEFFNRDHSNRSSRYLGKRQVRQNSFLSGFLGTGPLPSGEWWDASLKGKILFPEWRVMQEYYRAVAEIPLSAGDRLRCHRSLAVYVLLHTPKLARDLVIAAEQFLRSIWSRAASLADPPRCPRTAGMGTPSRTSD